MKKLRLLLVIFLIIQMYCGFTFVSAQEGENESKIKNLIERYINASLNKDVDSAMQAVSANYSNTYTSKDKTIPVDYNKFRLILEQIIAVASIKYSDPSLVDVKILESNIQGDKADVKFEYTVKAVNLITVENEEVKSKLALSLAKEGNDWKIIKLNSLN